MKKLTLNGLIGGILIAILLVTLPSVSSGHRSTR